MTDLEFIEVKPMNKPITIRLSIYVALACGSAFMASGGDIVPDEMTPWKWTLFFTGVVMAGLTTLRAFLDQTVSRENGLPEDKPKPADQPGQPTN
jgi:hypothetical protein